MATHSDETVQNLIINTVPNEETFRQITKEPNQIYFIEDSQSGTPYLIGGNQTTTSSADGGENVFTFEKSDGNTATFTVKNGSKGSPGVDGTSAAWFTGTAMSGTGTKSVTVTGAKAGDMYLNTSTADVYKANSASSWTYQCNIKGAQGNPGTNGTSAQWFTGTAMSGTGTKTATISGAHIGDMYLNTSTYDVYRAVSSATSWTYQCNIKGAQGDPGAKGDPGIIYGTCSTGASTTAKTVSITGFTLATGAQVVVKFSNTNTATTPTLNVNSTGAKAIRYKDNTYKDLNNAYFYHFVYDGTYWQLVDIPQESSYTLPTASSSTLGGIKVGSNLSINASGVLSATNTTYTAGNGISISNNAISNTGVINITEGSVNGKTSINGGSDVTIIKGLRSAAYTESSAYLPSSGNVHLDGALLLNNDNILIPKYSGDNFEIRNNLTNRIIFFYVPNSSLNIGNDQEENLMIQLMAPNTSFNGNICFEQGYQQAERTIRFKSGSGYFHNCCLYGGDPGSTTGLGLWDTKNSQAILVYNDQEATPIITIGAVNNNSQTYLRGDTIFYGPIKGNGGSIELDTIFEFINSNHHMTMSLGQGSVNGFYVYDNKNERYAIMYSDNDNFLHLGDWRNYTTNISLNGSTFINGGASIAGNISFDSGNQTSERQIRFQSTSGTYKHNCTLYGGNPSSTTGIGIYDSLNGRVAFMYNDEENNISFGSAGNYDTNIYLNGSVRLKGHSSEIGSTITGTRTSKTIANNATASNIMSITLPAGTWVIVGSFYTSPIGNENATGVLYMTLGGMSTGGDYMADNASGYGTNSYCPATSKYLEGMITTIANITSSTTYYLNAFQNIGTGSLTVYGNIRAVRIA